MSKAYITKSNFNSIITGLEKIPIDKFIPNDPIYKTPVFFISKKEEERILGQKFFLEYPNDVFLTYKKKGKVDTHKYIYEGNQSSYHNNINCDALNSNFSNYEIPEEIRIEGENHIKNFRKWFKENYHLYVEKPDLWAFKLQIAFSLSYIPTPIQRGNSGTTELENLDLKELEKRIDDILATSVKFYNDNPDKQKIIQKFAKYTWLAKKGEPIHDNNTKLSDDDLKSFLNEYDFKFKKPFKDLLLHYYMIKYNPDLAFDGLLLEQLGFKPCGKCCISK